MPPPQAAYRLELWFNANDGSSTLNWGVVQSNNNSYDFNGGARVVSKDPDGKVAVTYPTGGPLPVFDIYVFDCSSDSVSRTLESIKIDYEYTGNGGPGNPIRDAAGLRTGITGQQFSGSATGYQGISNENKVWSLGPPGIQSQNRWSLWAGYEGLTAGNFQFTGTITVSGPSGDQTFSFDPEMDIYSN